MVARENIAHGTMWRMIDGIFPDVLYPIVHFVTLAMPMERVDVFTRVVQLDSA
jgi:hypothetical protein